MTRGNVQLPARGGGAASAREGLRRAYGPVVTRYLRRGGRAVVADRALRQGHAAAVAALPASGDPRAVRSGAHRRETLGPLADVMAAQAAGLAEMEAASGDLVPAKAESDSLCTFRLDHGLDPARADLAVAQPDDRGCRDDRDGMGGGGLFRAGDPQPFLAPHRQLGRVDLGDALLSGLSGACLGPARQHFGDLRQLPAFGADGAQGGSGHGASDLALALFRADRLGAAGEERRYFARDPGTDRQDPSGRSDQPCGADRAEGRRFRHDRVHGFHRRAWRGSRFRSAKDRLEPDVGRHHFDG